MHRKSISANLINRNKWFIVLSKKDFYWFSPEQFGSKGWLHQSTTMSHTYGDDNSDFVDYKAITLIFPGVLDSIQLQQVAGIT